MMDPTLQVLPRDGLPERRALILTSTEESYGFAIGEGVNALVDPWQVWFTPTLRSPPGKRTPQRKPPSRLFTDAAVALGVGVRSSVGSHARRFLLTLGETGTGGGDAGRQIHLVRAHCCSGTGVRCDHLDGCTHSTDSIVYGG